MQLGANTMVQAVTRDAESAPTFSGLEVATLTADTLRANVRITGDLALNSVALLTSVLRTHIATGRRYLRVDLAEAHILDLAVVDTLAELHRAVSELGGMLTFENAGAGIVDALRGTGLFVNAASA